MSIKSQGGVFGRNPTFNDVTVDGDLSTAGNITTNGLSIASGSNIFLDGGGDTYIDEFTDNTIRFVTGSKAAFKIENSPTNSLVIDGSGNATMNNGNLIIGTSGNGIDFSATAGTGTSELFDDYEEGTWTPVISDATSGGNTASGTFVGVYTKIGNIVTATCSALSIDTTGMTAGNNVHIQGLPFASSSISGTVLFTGAVHLNNITTGGNNFVSVLDNAAYFRIGEVISGAGADYVVVSELSSGSAAIFFTISYEAA